MRRLTLLAFFGALPAACTSTPESVRTVPGYLGIEKVSLFAKGIE